MPEMATVCQDPTGTPPSMFGGRGAQGIGPPHNYYNHCGYQTPAPHGHYATDGYGTFQQTPQAEPVNHQQHHLQPQHLPQHHHNQQQSWGYGLPMAANGRTNHGAINDEWTYMIPGGSSTPTQNHYNYQYRPNTHTPLDYASPLSVGQDPNPQGLEGSPSPGAPSPGESPGAGIGPNNQGAKSLRPPYEWMKPSAGLPQSGKTRTKDKYRVVYSDHQRLELEKEFHFSKYITIRRKTEIAGQLGLSERQVKIWFQNRRAKERKQNKKRQEVTSDLQHQTGGAGSNHSNHQEQPHQHHMLQGPTHDPHLDTHSHSFLKTEKDDEFPIKHELTGHSTTLTPLIPQGQASVIHQNHHTMGMIGAPAILGRSHAHPSMPRYHEGVVQHPAMTPPSPGGELSYRLGSNNGTDSAGNSMNLSGSSDSGVLSSH